MLRGSRPGERRGGRKRDTPNRRTILTDRILSIGLDHPTASRRAFLHKLVKDRKLPADTRMAVAPKCFPPKRTPSSRSRPSTSGGRHRTTGAQKGLATAGRCGSVRGLANAGSGVGHPRLESSGARRLVWHCPGCDCGCQSAEKSSAENRRISAAQSRQEGKSPPG